MIATAPDYQFLKDFIDMMFGILVILFILKFTLICLKYVLSPIKLFFQGIMYILNLASEKSKNFVDEYEENINNKKKNMPSKNQSNNGQKVKIVQKSNIENVDDNCKVIDFSKIRRK